MFKTSKYFSQLNKSSTIFVFAIFLGFVFIGHLGYGFKSVSANADIRMVQATPYIYTQQELDAYTDSDTVISTIVGTQLTDILHLKAMMKISNLKLG